MPERRGCSTQRFSAWSTRLVKIIADIFLSAGPSPGPVLAIPPALCNNERMANQPNTQPVTTPALMSTLVEIVSAPFRPLAEMSALGYFPTVHPGDCSHDDLRPVFDDCRCCRDCGEIFECDHESQGASITVEPDEATCSGCNTTWTVIACNECGWPIIEGVEASCENCTADAP